MNIRNCKKCKKLFNYITGDLLCPGCKEIMESNFKVVKDYLEKNPKSSIENTSEACNVSASDIKTWLREGRLELSEDSIITLECRSCGKKIRSGILCDICSKTLSNEANGIIRTFSITNEKNQTKNVGYYLKD